MPLTLALDGGEWADSFAPRLLYTQGHSPQYPLYKGLGGPHSLSGCLGEEKNILSVPEMKSQLIGCPAYSLITSTYYDTPVSYA
jgi:hypothetical protein